MTPPMTQPDLARLEGLLKAASALPWREEESEQAPFLVIRAPYDGDVDGDGRSIIVGGEEICRFTDQELDIENSELIVAAVNSLPALLARVWELERELRICSNLLSATRPRDGYDLAWRCERAVTRARATLALNKENPDADR